jgi:hypothetical protein
MNCKAIDGLIRYLTGIIPGGVLLSRARFRFTPVIKCKAISGLTKKCKFESGLLTKLCKLFSGRVSWSMIFKICSAGQLER